MICSSSIKLHIPSRNQIQARLYELSAITHSQILDTFPRDSRMSIALDCWTSPHQKPFMAITGYFIDTNWKYKEVLLGFPSIPGSHSGMELGKVVISVLKKFGLTSRILGITTDNASNNNTMFGHLTDTLKEELKDNQSSLLLNTAIDPDLAAVIQAPHHIPCLTHVIQLAVNAFLDELNISPKNDEVRFYWDSSERDKIQGGIVGTLEKVC